MKLMFMKYAEKMRGGRVDFTPEELETAMTGWYLLTIYNSECKIITHL